LIDWINLKEYLLVNIGIVDESSREIIMVPKGERYIKFIERIRNGRSGT
jgi:hypothetical protein